VVSTVMQLTDFTGRRCFAPSHCGAAKATTLSGFRLSRAAVPA
jgi:hypothetical protein